jgi:transcriptional regulator with XRE-family HTH domain
MNAKLPAAAKAHSWRNGRTLGAAVRRAREGAGLTISELARRAGVGRKFMHELEAGKDTLRADKVFDVLSVLGLELGVLPARRGRTAGAEAWLKRNRAALDAYNEHIEKHGVFSEGLRSF